MGIRVVPNETVPATVYRILLPYERSVIAVRFHPAVLAVPIVAAFSGLIIAVALSFQHLSADAMAITWSTWGLAFLYGIFRVRCYLKSYFVVTPKRLLLISGFLALDVTMAPLATATPLRFQRSFLGRLLGYGQFIFEGVSASQGIRTVRFLPYPEQLYLEVVGLILPDNRDIGGSDD